jgi:hypothetical protein
MGQRGQDAACEAASRKLNRGHGLGRFTTTLKDKQVSLWYCYITTASCYDDLPKQENGFLAALGGL